MRKTFKLFCAAAVALLAVSSCGKIWDEFDNVYGEIDALETRVKALEDNLNAQVETLNGKIADLDAAYKAADAAIAEDLLAEFTALAAQVDALDGKVDGQIKSQKEALEAAIKELKGEDAKIWESLLAIGVSKVEANKDGNVVVTFLDGTSLEVPTHPEEGLVTVVEDEDGVICWAVIVDGEPVSLEVPVGHIDLEFQVDDYNLQYSVDGGETWVRTDAYVSDSYYSLLTDFYQGGELNFDTWEYEENDYFTLVFGGEEYYLPLYKADNASISLKSGKTYFKYGETKEVALNVAGMADYYVMNKPDGWKAKLEGKTLVVTAPTEALVDLGVADLDGEVLLHATSTEGKCVVVKFSVSTLSGLEVKVNVETGMVTISNPYAYAVAMPGGDDEIGDMPMPLNDVPAVGDDDEVEEEDEYVPTHEFAQIMMGLAPIDAFAADPVAYVKSIYNGEKWSDIYTFSDNFRTGVYDEDDELKYPMKDYVAGSYEVDEFVFEIADLYAYGTYGEEMEKGSHFVVWAVAFDEQNEMMIDDLSFVYYEPVEVSVEEVEASFSDIEVKLSLYGAEKFLVGFVPETAFAEYGFTFDQYMQMQGEGPFAQFVNVGAMEGYEEYAEYYMGAAMPNGTEDVFMVSALNAEGFSDILAPSTTYYVWAMPVVAGVSYADYSYDEHFKPYVYTFTTEDLVYDETSEAAAEITYEATVKTISAEVEVTDAVLAYYAWYESEDEVNALTAEELAEDVVAYGYPAVEFPISINETRLQPESTHVLVVVSVDEDGCYADPEVKVIKTKAVPYTDAYSAELTALDVTDLSSVTATFAVTGDAQKVVCYPAYYDYYTSNVVDWLLDYSINYYSFVKADVVNGTAVVSGLKCSTNKNLIWVACSEDAEGNLVFTEPQVVDVTTWTPDAE